MVRRASLEEIEHLVNLGLQLWSGHQKAELAEEFTALLKKDSACFFLKYYENQPIGFAQCQLRFDYVEGTSSSPVGYLEGIYLSPAFRGKDFGKELLAACEKWAAEKDCREFASDCELDNAESFAFHKAMGFTEANRIICFTKPLVNKAESTPNTGKVILETERLYLREMTRDDFCDLAEILQNPRVMYAYEHDFSDDDVQEWLNRQQARYKKYGFGLWAMILKETGKMIGQAGLTMQPYKGGEVLEIGYHLKEEFWHKGYATEAALGCKTYAFDTLQQDKVHCIIKADNTASQNVAKRIGMEKEDSFITQYYNGDMLHDLFVVRKNHS